jgi:benzoyl-CoA reductase subunit D
MTYAIGIDVGSGAVKSVLFDVQGNRQEWLAKRCERIRRRDPMQLAREGCDGVLADAGLHADQVDYIATTGEGENVPFATGHFYSMTTHARGGVFLHPGISAVVDIGALNGRAIYVDERGKVLSYKMTSQCASGSGQFLENIARYLGVAVEEIGPLSKTSQNPEKCSSICAVLAETDVINMVSRGIATPDVLKGIHLSMASRIVKLLKVTGIIRPHRGDRRGDGQRESESHRREPPRLDLCRGDRRGLVGGIPPPAAERPGGARGRLTDRLSGTHQRRRRWH